MAITPLENDRIGQSYTPANSSTPVAGPTQTATGDTAWEFYAIVPHGTTAHTIVGGFTQAKLRSLVINVTATDPATTVTFANGTDTVVATAGVELIWKRGSGTCPFTIDTNSSAPLTVANATLTADGDATIFARFLQDSTL